DHLLFLGLEEGLHGAALSEDGLDVLGLADVVELPEVEMAGVEQLERFFEHAQGTVASALLGLAGEEGFSTAALHDLADVALAPAVRTAVDGGSIDVIHAQVESALDDRDGGGLVVSTF